MALNLQFGPPMSGVSGAVGLAAGQGEYALRKQNIESQARQQRLQNVMGLINTGLKVAQPFVSQAIRQQDQQFSAGLKAKEEKKRYDWLNSDAYISTGMRGDATRLVEGTRQWNNAITNGLDYLKTIGPSDAGAFEDQTLGSVKYGGGSGKLNPQQFKAAVGNLLTKSERIGSLAMGSPRTQAEKFTDNVHTDEEGNRYWVSPDGGRMEPLTSRKDTQRNKFIEYAMRYQQVLDGVKAKGVESVISTARRNLEALYNEGDQKIEDGVDAAAQDYLRNFPDNPFGNLQKLFPEFISGEGRVKVDDVDNMGGGRRDLTEEAAGGPRPELVTSLGYGNPPYNTGASDQPPLEAPPEAVRGQYIDEMTSRWGPAGGRQAQLEAGANETKRGIPALAKEMANPEWDSMINSMSATRFKTRDGKMREVFDERLLKSALSMVRRINREEVDSIETSNLALHQTGSQGNHKHMMRAAALTWLKNSISQYQLSVDAAEDGKAPKLLYGEEALPMPEMLEEYIKSGSPEAGGATIRSPSQYLPQYFPTWSMR